MPIVPADPAQQKKILVGIFPLLLAVGYGYLVHADLKASVGALDARLQRLDAQNEQAAALGRRGSAELHRRVERYREQLTRLEQLIPAEEDVPALLQAINLCAEDTGAKLLRLAPEDVATEDPADLDEHYRLRTFQLTISGGYHDIGRFLTAVGSLPRIVTPRDVRMFEAHPDDPALTRGGDRELAADLRIQTYVLPAAASPEMAPSLGASGEGGSPRPAEGA